MGEVVRFQLRREPNPPFNREDIKAEALVLDPNLSTDELEAIADATMAAWRNPGTRFLFD
jgi:hypothetical protein